MRGSMDPRQLAKQLEESQAEVERLKDMRWRLWNLIFFLFLMAILLGAALAQQRGCRGSSTKQTKCVPPWPPSPRSRTILHLVLHGSSPAIGRLPPTQAA